MSQRDVKGVDDKGEAGEETVGDLEVLDGEDVRGGADRRHDDDIDESITFVHQKI
jgi:hypothetical protein